MLHLDIRREIAVLPLPGPLAAATLRADASGQGWQLALPGPGGEWLYDTGLPGKSGVSGGIVAVAPGKGGLSAFAPPLDAAGNSVRGQLAARFLAERLGLNLFASKPSTP